jgi:hypothetical protein
MAVRQLRNHIPIAAPARREAEDGTASAMRVSLGFEPAWFCRRCDVDFSERWHRDPLYRYQTLRAMQAELCRAFPEVRYWKGGALQDLATISGCYGAYVIPQLFGFKLRYSPERWPGLEPGRKLSVQEVEQLDAGRLLAGPFVDELFEQMEIIERHWGGIYGYLNWQGVLNNAFHLRGQDIFLDLQDRAGLADHLFSMLAEVMMGLAQRVQQRQRQSGFYVDHLCVSNCTLNMISPQTYRQFLFRHDAKIAASFERFGVHTCNWNVTPYLEVLQSLPKVGYLDMGMESNLARAKEMFPDARRAVLYSPVRLQEASVEEIAADMEKIHRELSPCDVVMADIQASTPDERVKELLKICARLEAQDLPAD